MPPFFPFLFSHLEGRKGTNHVLCCTRHLLLKCFGAVLCNQNRAGSEYALITHSPHNALHMKAGCIIGNLTCRTV